jgi:hypothetical protein
LATTFSNCGGIDGQPIVVLCEIAHDLFFVKWISFFASNLANDGGVV